MRIYDLHIPALKDFGGIPMTLEAAHQKLRNLGISLVDVPEGMELNDFECHNPTRAVLFDVRDERVVAVELVIGD